MPFEITLAGQELCSYHTLHTGALFIWRCFAILTFFEPFFGQLIVLGDLFEDGEDEVRYVESEARYEFLFRCSIDLVPALQCVYGLKGLLE